MSINQQEAIARGSRTAKNGFKNEYDVIDKFNNWKNDEDAQRWIGILNLNKKFIENLKATKVSGHYKPDVLVDVKYKDDSSYSKYISVKLVSNKKGYNQLDKRWSVDYQNLWSFSRDVLSILRLFSGEDPHNKPDIVNKKSLKLSQIDKHESDKVLEFFQNKRLRILSDIIKGRDHPAGYMLVAQKNSSNVRWVMKNIEDVINFYNQGNVEISKKGNLKIGRITLQRKGGDRGAESAKMLQFKFDPVDLFDFVVLPNVE